MASRMERYYKSGEVKTRLDKNKDLYRTIYDEVEYSNVEGISVIEKNEKIDLDKIRELINGSKEPPKVRTFKEPISKPIVDEEPEERNYDIRDVLDKAKTERSEKDNKVFNTQYNILKGINLNEQNNSDSLDEKELKDMIEAISTNSKAGYTTDLLDDLKSIYDSDMKKDIKNELDNDETMQNTKLIESNIDKSFFTSSLDFSSDDFEDLKEIKENIKKNNLLTKILLFILLVIVMTGAMFLIYHFTR